MHAIVRPTRGESAAGLLAAACLLAVACNGDGGSPTGPTPPSTGATSSVSVTYPEDHGTICTIYIGDQVQFQATVSSGAGTQATTNAAWQSDAPAVATVSSSGLVTGVSAGEATISAEVPASRRLCVDRPIRDSLHRWDAYADVRRGRVPPARQFGRDSGSPDVLGVTGRRPLVVADEKPDGLHDQAALPYVSNLARALVMAFVERKTNTLFCRSRCAFSVRWGSKSPHRRPQSRFAFDLPAFIVRRRLDRQPGTRGWEELRRNRRRPSGCPATADRDHSHERTAPS